MSVTSKKIIIKFQDERIWFDSKESIEIQATNLPDDNCTLTSRPFYWEIIPKTFNKNKGTLEVAISNFNPKVSSPWIGSCPKYRITSINFHNLNWDDFSLFVSSYNNKAKLSMPSSSTKMESARFHEVTLTERIRLMDLKFEKGHVSFDKCFSWASDEQLIKIHNPHIFPQLKLLLPYLIKLLKKKTINVELKIGRENGKTTYINAISKDIDKINQESLQVIKVFQLDDTRKKLRDSNMQNIFNPPPQIIDDIILGNIDSFERELLFSILSKEEVRNKHQLNHLSSLLSDKQKLFLTIDPQFGFVFRIEGEEMIHFIWELVNSHATYIWSFPKDITPTSQLQRIEEEFAVLTQHGRSYYKSYFENSDALFLNIVNHSTTHNPMVDQFNRWRMRVEGLMI